MKNWKKRVSIKGTRNTINKKLLFISFSLPENIYGLFEIKTIISEKRKVYKLSIIIKIKSRNRHSLMLYLFSHIFYNN